MQEIRLEGNIGQDAQIKTTQSGKQYATFSLGCSEKTGRKLPDGKDEYQTTWYDVFCNLDQVPSLTKGKRVLVIGRPTFRAYTNNQGQAVATCSVQFANIYLQLPRPQQNPQQTQGSPIPIAQQTPLNNPAMQQLQNNFSGQPQYQAPPQYQTPQPSGLQITQDAFPDTPDLPF